MPCGWRATCNPGGPGHQWVKAYAIDPAPSGYEPIQDGEQVFTFIPSFVEDNPYLGADYIANLKSMGSEELVRKYLHGDWSAIDGAYFDNWEPRRHVVRPVELPDHWLRFRSIDWGSFRPFSVGWWAVAAEDMVFEGGVTLPRGGLVRYREWYGASKPNVGLKLTAEQVAAGILQRTPADESITYTIADPAMMSEDGGPSLSERFALNGVPLLRGDNKRTGRGGAMGGWDMLRTRLDGEDDDRPMIVFFNTCTDTIRTLPALQHDDHKPEDVNTDQEDHAADEIRYAAMSRPWIRDAPREYDAIKEAIKPQTFEQLVAAHDEQQPTRRRL